MSSQEPMTINMVAFYFYIPGSKHKGHKVSLKYFLVMLSAKLVLERKLLTLSEQLTWPMIATFFNMIL